MKKILLFGVIFLMMSLVPNMVQSSGPVNQYGIHERGIDGKYVGEGGVIGNVPEGEPGEPVKDIDVQDFIIKSLGNDNAVEEMELAIEMIKRSMVAGDGHSTSKAIIQNMRSMASGSNETEAGDNVGILLRGVEKEKRGYDYEVWNQPILKRWEFDRKSPDNAVEDHIGNFNFRIYESGGTIQIPAKKVVRFKAGSDLAKTVA